MYTHNYLFNFSKPVVLDGLCLIFDLTGSYAKCISFALKILILYAKEYSRVLSSIIVQKRGVRVSKITNLHEGN